MFFSGDPALRRRVELRGRSTRENDRQSTLNKARDEREQRQRARQHQRSALKIQKCYRGRRDVALHRIRLLEHFKDCYGQGSARAERNVFKPESKYLPELFFFTSSSRPEELWGACRHFSRCLLEAGGDVLALFVSTDYAIQKAAVNYRVKHFAILCLRALHDHREALKVELTLSRGNVVRFLVESLLALTRVDLPWFDYVLKHLAQDRLFHRLRDLLLTVDPVNDADPGVTTSLGLLVHQLCLRSLQRASFMECFPLAASFPMQIYSVPLLWQRVPLIKQLSVTEGIWAYVVRRIAKCIPVLRTSFPPDVGPEFPSVACFLGNMLEAARLGVTQPNFDIQLMTEFAGVGMFTISILPPACCISPGKAETDDEDDDDAMQIDDWNHGIAPDSALMTQFQHAADVDFLKNLVRIAFSQDPATTGPIAVCGFIYAAFFLLDSKTVLSGLAYSANILPLLWKYIRSCYLSKKWLADELYTEDSQLTPEFLGWMMPLAVYCPVLSRLLYSLDNDEFYAMNHPMTVDDLTDLVLVVKEALWHLLCVLSSAPPSFPSSQIFVFHNMRAFLIKVFSSLLGELYDRNSKRSFAPSDVFHVKEAVEDSFIAEAEDANTGARELLNNAPFLIPFTWRVRVYTARIAAVKTDHMEGRDRYTEARVKVRRDRIVGDSFDQINILPAHAFHGSIRVSYVNELGVDEAGVDGGGMFKDFMEGIIKAAFDIQYGLFQETADHLLYPSPASHVVHDNHLSYFEFLGKILGKAMFDGILVDIPFAGFFLRKLRRKNNYLHDLPSLDPELYKNLLYLKNNADMISQLGLYFVIEDSYFGQQREVELLPGGRDMQVTSENVFRYIHLVANHRLNNEIRPQSSHFLRGFQQVISPDWIDMFNEHELQVLISGSEDMLDIDDLQANTIYSGGYREDHPVIELFWETMKSLDVDMQRKFLKFATGCSRGPLLGFQYLEPLFCIQKTAPDTDGREVVERLPTSATCMNLLKLPPYQSKETLREKIVYAITSNAGFDLS